MALHELFRMQTQTHIRTLTSGMLGRAPAGEQLDTCARAARSLKTMARICGLEESAELAEAMESCFAVAQRSKLALPREQIHLILRGVDLLGHLANTPQRVRAAGHTGERIVHAFRSHAARGHRADGRVEKVKRVLVVDDSLEARESECALLRRHGYEVEATVDGVDAWNALCSADFDLVLADMDMPLFDGIRLLRTIRKDPRFALLPVLIVCDDGCEEQRRRVFESGADYYVIKNRLRDTLLQTVASLIGPVRA